MNEVNFGCWYKWVRQSYSTLNIEGGKHHNRTVNEQRQDKNEVSKQQETLLLCIYATIFLNWSVIDCFLTYCSLKVLNIRCKVSLLSLYESHRCINNLLQTTKYVHVSSEETLNCCEMSRVLLHRYNAVNYTSELLIPWVMQVNSYIHWTCTFVLFDLRFVLKCELFLVVDIE